MAEQRRTGHTDNSRDINEFLENLLKKQRSGRPVKKVESRIIDPNEQKSVSEANPQPPRTVNRPTGTSRLCNTISLAFALTAMCGIFYTARDTLALMWQNKYLFAYAGGTIIAANLAIVFRVASQKTGTGTSSRSDPDCTYDTTEPS